MEYVTHTIYFCTPGSDGCMKVEVQALEHIILPYALEVWLRLEAGGFEMKSAKP
jgi:hypothetical protein